MTTLDGIDRALDVGTILITDDAGPIAIAGVMGGAETEVTDATRTILLEAATFHFPSIRRASRDLKLPSESSWRFSRDVPPALIDPGSAVGSRLLAEHAGGRVAPGIVDVYPRPRPAVEVVMPLSEIDRLLGAEIPVADIEAILARLGFTAVVDGDTLAAVVPPHRVDIELPADIVEEIVRVWGLDRLPSVPLADALPAQRENRTQWLEEATRDACVGAGLQEIVSYRMTSVGHEGETVVAGIAGIADDVGTGVAEAGYVGIANAISPERSAMRQSMLTGLLDAAAANLRFTDRVALFEVGSTYHWPAGTSPSPTTLPDEPRHVALLVAGPQRADDWRGGEARHMDFYDAKGVVEAILGALGIDTLHFAPGRHASLHPGRTAVVSAVDADGTPRALGHVGELHPVVRRRWDLPERSIAVADLDLEAIDALAGAIRPIAAFSPYPPVERDLAVLVDEAIPAADVEAAVRAAGGKLLVGVRLFDVYRGPQVGEGRKSLALRLRFQSMDKTLEGASVDRVREQIVRALGKAVGGEVRG